MFRQAMTLQVVAEPGRRYTNHEHKRADRTLRREGAQGTRNRTVRRLPRDRSRRDRGEPIHIQLLQDATRQRSTSSISPPGPSPNVPPQKPATSASSTTSAAVRSTRSSPPPKARTRSCSQGPAPARHAVVVRRCALPAQSGTRTARTDPRDLFQHRSAMYELRSRIRALVGAELGRRVAIHTYHSLALRLCERSLAAERLHLRNNPYPSQGRKHRLSDPPSSRGRLLQRDHRRSQPEATRPDKTVDGRDARRPP